MFFLSICFANAQPDFLKAVAEGDTAKVRIMFEQKKAKIKYKDKNSVTPLMKATKNKHLNMVELLVGKKADVNANDKNGISSLMISSLMGDTAILNYLINHKAKINEVDNNEKSALIMASDTGWLEVVKILVENGAKLDHFDNMQNNAMLLATQNGFLEIVQYLLEKGANVNAQDIDGYSALMYAASNDHIEMVETLANKGADLHLMDNNKYRFSAIVLASKAESYEIVEYLLKESLKDTITNQELVEAKKGQALLMAVMKNYQDIVRLLLQYKTDVNSINRDGYTSLMYASMYGFVEIASTLLENKANPNIKHYFLSKTALDWAKQKKFVEIERMLLRVGGKEGWEVY